MSDASSALSRLFAELVNGAPAGGGAFILNSGDSGLLRSLDVLSAADASRSANGGATIAAHVLHLRFGLSLMNAWAVEGDNPHVNPRWDEAWKVSAVDAAQWDEIRAGLRAEAARWLDALGAPRDTSARGLAEMMGSIAHLAYHIGAIRQIAQDARGPKEGTFT